MNNRNVAMYLYRLAVSAHRILHLLCCRTLEVQEVRLRVLRPVSAAPCKQILENLHGLIEKFRLTGLFAPFAIIMAVTAGLSGCHGHDADNEIAVEKTVRADTSLVQKMPIPDMRFFPGRVKSKVAITLSPKMPGYVQEIPHEIGDFIKKGELIVKLDDRDIRARIASLRQSENAVNRQQASLVARLKYAQATFDRINKLHAEGSATQDEFDRISAEKSALASQAQALAAQARQVAAALDEAENQLRYVEIRAPSDGRITARMVDRGTFVMPGMPLVKFENSGSGAWFAADIDASLINSVQAGQPVTIFFPSLNRTLKVEISQAATAARTNSHSFAILCDISSSGIKSGIYGRVFIAGTSVERPVAPCRSIVDRGGLKGVFVAGTDGRLHWRVIKTGRIWSLTGGTPALIQGEAAMDEKEGCRAEILAGLEPGEKVVISNLARVHEGLRLE